MFSTDVSIEDCPFNGLVCSVCGSSQRTSPNGETCDEGHGGVAGMTPLVYAPYANRAIRQSKDG